MQPPRGTRDFGPTEMARRRQVETQLRHILRTFNYREVQTPTFEDLDLFLAKSGPGVRDEIYEFKDKSDRALALRPELTAPVMRFYFESMRMEPKPLRLFYFGPCFRYDRPQSGRYREFWQLGCELIGDDSPEAHAELLRLVQRLFEGAGLQQYVLRVGHLEILRQLLEEVGVARKDQGPLMRAIDKKDLPQLEMDLKAHASAERIKTLLALFQVSTLEALRPHCSRGPAQDALRHLERVLEALKLLGGDTSKVRVDPTIARGLEYYTGIVFELDAPDLGAEKQLLGGGAYDLASVFRQAPISTVGFAIGFDRTLLALEKAGSPIGPHLRVAAYVAGLDEEGRRLAYDAAAKLRDAGISVELELAPANVKKVLSRAAKMGARTAVFMGAAEARRGVAAVKYLDPGTQTDVPLKDLVAELSAHVMD